MSASGESPPAPVAAGRRRIVMAGVATIVVVFFLFSGALQNGFVSWDDQFYVTDNPHLKISSVEDLLWFFTHSYYWSYIPLTLLSHAADYALWGMEPHGHHLTSILLHAANSVWVLLLSLTVIRRAMRNPRAGVSSAGGERGALGAALVATALFAIHPLRVESVAWVSDRKDLLCAFFLFPAFLLYLRRQDKEVPAERDRGTLALLALHMFALLSKAIAMVFPVVMTGADPFLLGRERWRSEWRTRLRANAPYFFLSVVAGVTGLLVVPEQGLNFMVQELSPVQKVLLPFHTLIAPLGKLFFPLGLSPLYDYPSAAVMWISALLAVFVTVLCVLLARRGEPSLLVAWGYYVLFSLPTAAFFATAIQPIADRYTYIAALSFPVLAGVWFGRFRAHPRRSARARQALTGGVVVVCVLYAILVVRQVPVWKSSLTLWQHAVGVAPSSPFAHNNLGEAYVTADYFEEAVVSYRIAVELHPRFPDAHNNLGVALLMQGQDREGVAALERALALYEEAGGRDPAIPDVVYNLGTARFRVGDFAGAMHYFRRAVAMRPAFLQARVYIGRTAEAMGDTLGARGAWQEAERLGSETAAGELRRLAGRGGP